MKHTFERRPNLQHYWIYKTHVTAKLEFRNTEDLNSPATMLSVHLRVFINVAVFYTNCIFNFKRIIIGSDRRPGTKQRIEGKIVRFTDREGLGIGLVLGIIDRRSEPDCRSEPNTVHFKIYSACRKAQVAKEG